MERNPEAPILRIFSDYESLSRAAAELFAKIAESSVRENGSCSIALSGGKTPRRMYELLASPSLLHRVPWERIDFFWSDERCVPPTDDRSNQRLARVSLLDQVPNRPERIHPFPTDKAPVEAARMYDALLRNMFAPAGSALELILLGLGEDGHTASLFPGSPVLDERNAWATHSRRPDETIARLTLTLPFINRSKKILVLVSGTEKSSILRTALNDSHRSGDLPILRVKPASGEMLYYVDRDAAASQEPSG